MPVVHFCLCIVDHPFNNHHNFPIRLLYLHVPQQQPQASLSEEVIQPERNMPIGIVGSLILSTLIYCCVTLSVVGMAPFRFLGETTPLVNAILANACCTHADQIQALENNDVNQCLACQVFESPVLAVVSKIVSSGAGLALFAACFTRCVLTRFQ